MTQRLAVRLTKRFSPSTTIEAEFEQPADGFFVTVLFGPSGCGKTTILRCLAGLERPESARISVSDEVWTDTATGVHLSPQARQIGFLSQDYALFPHLTVRANIAYGLVVAQQEAARRVAELIDALQLTRLEQRYPRELSGGQQQRVALARAVARRPRLLLLDEPLSALDAGTRQQLRGQLRQLLSQWRIPTVAVTHDRVEAIALADQVVVMDAGQVLQLGNVEEIFARPLAARVAEIVGVETVVPAMVTGAEDGLCHVQVGSIRLTAVAGAGAPTSGPAYLCIRAEEVLLQPGPVDASSARNRLTGRIIALSPEGPLVRVTIDVGFALQSLVTRQSVSELNLEPGQPITALIKAPSIHLVPR